MQPKQYDFSTSDKSNGKGAHITHLGKAGPSIFDVLYQEHS